jgi:CheY-like chemotaxis protein
MRRVLVVEDEENIRMLMRRFLSHEGFTVETAIDGKDGIDRLAADSAYDVMVLDLMMPRVSGLGVLQYLEEANPAMIAHTVVATAYPGVLPPDQLGRVCRIIRKPFELTALLEAIEACAA